MIIVKTEQEIDVLREPCAIVRDTLAYVGSLVRPGVTTQELNDRAEAYIRSRGFYAKRAALGADPRAFCRAEYFANAAFYQKASFSSLLQRRAMKRIRTDSGRTRGTTAINLFQNPGRYTRLFLRTARRLLRAI